MLNTHHLFKKLGRGAKFDFSKYKADAEQFKLKKTEETLIESSTVPNLSYAEISNNSSTTEKKVKKKRCLEEEDSEEEDVTILRKVKKKRVLNKKQNRMRLKEQHIEKVNVFRKKNNIRCYGSDIPDPVETFENISTRFGLSKKVIRNITVNQFDTPTPIQMQAIPIMLQNRELLACAPTGSGKTLAFILPLLCQLNEARDVGFRAVVISPTRELAQQIYREFNRMNETIGLRIHLLTKAKASSNIFITSSKSKCDILISTPNRLVHLLERQPPGVSLNNVEWLILDEGDKLFEPGDTGFRDQVATIYRACDNPSVKRALFSATLANNVEEWCKLHLDNVVRVTIGTKNSATKTVDQKLLFVGQESGKLLAIRQHIQSGFHPPVLIFVQSKERAKELFNELIYDQINVDVIHSDRTQAQRDEVVKNFRSGKTWILIATELMGRGIDFKGVNLVINYDFPPTAVSYIHRIGRTGRAGRKGQAITLFTEDDIPNLRSIANVMKASGCDIPEWMLTIPKQDRRTKKKLSKVPMKRESIKTVTKYDIARQKHKRQVIDMTKAKQNKNT